VHQANRSSAFGLAFAADDNFGEGLGVAVYSALVHLAPAASPEVYVLDNGLSDPSWGRLTKVVGAARPGVALHRVKIAAEHLGPVADDSHLSAAAYSRVLIPELVPSHVSRVIYLDVDVLVRRDLAPLFTLDLGGAPVAAVRDYYTSSTAHELSDVRDRANPRPYYNTGVLVIDVRAWRDSGLAERVLQYARAGPRPLRFADQDALNGVVETWFELDYRWNVQQLPRHIYAAEWPRVLSETEEYSYRARWQLFRAAVVLHFISSIKPWRYSCATAGTRAWMVALIQSGWYSPRETFAWLVRWHAPRLGYQLRSAVKRLHRRADPSGLYDRLTAGRK
jgi:lipopolysaccharide biosynthesis glycosyltransferase